MNQSLQYLKCYQVHKIVDHYATIAVDDCIYVVVTYTVVNSVPFIYQVYLESGMLSARHSSVNFSPYVALVFSENPFFHFGPAEMQKQKKKFWA